MAVAVVANNAAGDKSNNTAISTVARELEALHALALARDGRAAQACRIISSLRAELDKATSRWQAAHMHPPTLPPDEEESWHFSFFRIGAEVALRAGNLDLWPFVRNEASIVVDGGGWPAVWISWVSFLHDGLSGRHEYSKAARPLTRPSRNQAIHTASSASHQPTRALGAYWLARIEWRRQHFHKSFLQTRPFVGSSQRVGHRRTSSLACCASGTTRA